MSLTRPSARVPLSLLGFALALGLKPTARAQTTITYTNGETSNTPRTTTITDPLTLMITSGSATESGAISGNGILTKTGAGTLIYAGVPSYGSGTSVNEGTLAFTGLNSFFQGTQPIFVAAGATLDTGDGGINLSVVSGTGIVTGTSNGGIFYSSAAQSLTVSLTGAMGLYSQSSVGTFSVQSVNTYTGPTYITSGNLVLIPGSSIAGTSETYIGDALTASLTVSGGALFSSAGTFSVAQNQGGNGTINLGAASTAAATAAGILDVASVTGGAGTATIQFNTTGTFAAPTFFTRDGTGSGTGVTTSGALQLVHTAGTTVITGNLAHTGGTTLNGGTLLANNLTGSAFGSGAVTVNSGATLGGSGFIAGLATLNAGAHLAPGNSLGSLTFSSGLTLSGGSTLDIELGTVSDLLRISGGTLTGPGSGRVTLNLSDFGGFTAGTYTLIDYTSATLSDFSATDFVLGTTIPGFTYDLALEGQSLRLTATASVIPEPASVASLAGLLALGLTAIRRRRRPAA